MAKEDLSHNPPEGHITRGQFLERTVGLGMSLFAIGRAIEHVGTAAAASGEIKQEQLIGPTRLTREEYNCARGALTRVNNGPPELNIVDAGAVAVGPGTPFRKAPMSTKGSIFNRVPNNSTGVLCVPREILVNGKLWLAVLNYDHMGYTRQAGDPPNDENSPMFTLWVDPAEAKNYGSRHLDPVNPHTGANWHLPPVYAVQPNGLNRLSFNSITPPEWSSLSIASFGIHPKKADPKNGWEYAINGFAFMPTARPLKFQAASTLASVGE